MSVSRQRETALPQGDHTETSLYRQPSQGEPDSLEHMGDETIWRSLSAPHAIQSVPILTRHFLALLTRMRLLLHGISTQWRMAIIAVALLLVTNDVLDSPAARQIVVDSNDWGIMRQLTACERQGKHPDVVIMGSSRAQAGIVPGIISDQLGASWGRQVIVCDIAVTTSIPLQDYYELRRLLQDGVHPRLIIYATAEYAFNSPVAETNLPVLENLPFVTGLGDLADLRDTPVVTQQEGQTNWTLNFIATHIVRPYGYRQGLQSALCRAADTLPGCAAPAPPAVGAVSTRYPNAVYPIDYTRGWYPLPEETERSLGNSYGQYTRWLKGYRVAPDAMNALARLVALARRDGAGVILVNTPIQPSHLQFLPHPTDYLHYLDSLHRFADAHQIAFYDEGLGAFSQPANFADTNHLNYWGSLQFTGFLTEQVIKPALRSA